ARCTTSVSAAAKFVPTCPSTVTSSSSGPSRPRMRTMADGGSTSGRIASVWGDTGVTTMDSTVGTTTGPPADSEYAVDPVGVDTTTPSAPYAPIGSPSIHTS